MYFNERSITVKGKFDENSLDKLCQHPPVLFGNRGKAVSKERIPTLNYSLLFIKTSHFEIVEKVYDDHKDRHKYRLLFTYNAVPYDLPITDPEFIHHYELNPDYLEGYTEVYLSLSLGVAWNDWYYKQAAAVIPNIKLLQPKAMHADSFDDLPF